MDRTEFVKVPAVVSGKIPEGDSAVWLGTHDGAFHCDDVCATALLLQLSQFASAKVVRTRKQDFLDKCNVVFDVGGVYDPSKLRFDHHQRTCEDKFPGRTATKMSSAGMVWLHFGKDILRGTCCGMTDDAKIQVVFERFYEGFLESVDAIDNGVNICDGEPRYMIRSDLSSRVARQNLEWNNPKVDFVCCEEFQAAVKIASDEIFDHLHKLIDIWLPARDIVEDALKNRAFVHPSLRVIELREGCPWEEHLRELEIEQGLDESETCCTTQEALAGTMQDKDGKRGSDTSILFVIHKHYGDDWRVRAVRKDKLSFGNRMDLAAEFRGLRDEEISKHPQGEGIKFVHAAGFLGGCASREAALRLVNLSLNQA